LPDKPKENYTPCTKYGIVNPKEAVVAVTYACNARCAMCNIWQNPPEQPLEPQHYRKLPRSLQTINITGGEPFLRKDLIDVLRAIDSVVPNSRMVFSTNGSLTETIVKTLEETRTFHRTIGVGVSIDGTEETHDKIRGVPGLFKKATRTVSALKERGYEDLRIAMTLTEQNATEARKVFDLSRELEVELSLTVAHSSEVYFKKKNADEPDAPTASVEDLNYIMCSQLKSKSPKDWYRAFHTQGMLDSSHRKKFSSKCEAAHRYFFLAPNGDVYPCNVLNKKIGNLRDAEDWSSIWTEEAVRSARKSVAACKKGCWMICNTRSLIVAHPISATSWVAKNKLLGTRKKKADA